jgi:Domain of unknown function (DUF4261)
MSAQTPRMITTALLLEREAPPIDYDAMVQRVGKVLGVDSAAIGRHKAGNEMAKAMVQGVENMLRTNPPAIGHPKVTAEMVLSIAGDVAFGLGIDFPYPDTAALQRIAQFTYWWPNALNDLACHKAHMMLSCSWTGHCRLDAHMRQMVLARESMEQLPVIGILWGSSLVQRDVFRGEYANATKGGVPFWLWVLIQFSKQPNGNILISTIGMRDFEKMEIEAESSLPLDKTFDLVRKFGSYILKSGGVVKDGDTVGMSETQKIKVRHARSFRKDVTTPVYRLDLSGGPTLQ